MVQCCVLTHFAPTVLSLILVEKLHLVQSSGLALHTVTPCCCTRSRKHIAVCATPTDKRLPAIFFLHEPSCCSEVCTTFYWTLPNKEVFHSCLFFMAFCYQLCLLFYYPVSQFLLLLVNIMFTYFFSYLLTFSSKSKLGTSEDVVLQLHTVIGFRVPNTVFHLSHSHSTASKQKKKHDDCFLILQMVYGCYTVTQLHVVKCSLLCPPKGTLKAKHKYI